MPEPLATMASASEIVGNIQRKMSGQGVIGTSGTGVIRARKGIILVIFNEDTDDITGVIKSKENSGMLIDVVSETVKQEIKGQEEKFVGMLLGTLGASMFGNMLTGKRCHESRKRCCNTLKKCCRSKMKIK